MKPSSVDWEDLVTYINVRVYRKVKHRVLLTGAYPGDVDETVLRAHNQRIDLIRNDSKTSSVVANCKRKKVYLCFRMDNRVIMAIRL